jgi:hypothetical protein
MMVIKSPNWLGIEDSREITFISIFDKIKIGAGNNLSAPRAPFLA